MGYAIEITKVPGRTVAVARFHVSAADLSMIGDRMGAAFSAVMANAGSAGVTPKGPAVACYEPAGDGFDVAAGFPVGEPFEATAEVDRLDLPAAEVAHTTHVGAYRDLPAAYDALREGVQAQGRSLAEDGPMWEEYWSAPGTSEEETRTEVYWPVAAG